MVKKAVLFFIILQLLFAIPLYAQDYNFLRKLARGFINLSLGWIELPKQMVETKGEGGAAGEIHGFFGGALKGITYFLGRTIVGGYEITTFAIPSYKPVFEPEFIFAEHKEKEE
ncbi:MAG: exosortase system-associated protein, TIGR04073 family [Candidatus Omnitrophica bacterium]|jgi:putative exosortase-associated protein (TIGR04073 family)|nr:exosortase system-associated protein, TIGR04073 family [Candidatus Omnitrophota bacterium]